MLSVASMRSRSASLGGALLWLAGTLVLPGLHLARHARPHDHEGGGIHYHLDADAHDDHDDDDDQPGGPFTVEAPHAHHGHAPHAAGLAHFLAATGEGAAMALAFTSEPDPERVPDAVPDRQARYFLEGRKAARAPPTA